MRPAQCTAPPRVVHLLPLSIEQLAHPACSQPTIAPVLKEEHVRGEHLLECIKVLLAPRTLRGFVVRALAACLFVESNFGFEYFFFLFLKIGYDSV